MSCGCTSSSGNVVLFKELSIYLFIFGWDMRREMRGEETSVRGRGGRVEERKESRGGRREERRERGERRGERMERAGIVHT